MMFSGAVLGLESGIICVFATRSEASSFVHVIQRWCVCVCVCVSF